MRLAGQWKFPQRGGLCRGIGLDRINGHIGLILQGKQQGRVLVSLGLKYGNARSEKPRMIADFLIDLIRIRGVIPDDVAEMEQAVRGNPGKPDPGFPLL